MMRRTLILVLATCALALSACLGRSQPAATATPAPLFTATQASAAASATLAAPLPTATMAAPYPAATRITPYPGAPASATPAASVPLATNAAPATPDPNEAVGDVVYQDKLDGKGGWFWTFSDEVAVFGVVDGNLKGQMKAANAGWRFTISPDTLELGGQQVSLNNHSVSCGPNDEYGLLLRVKADASQAGFDGYLLKLRCSGAASFEMITGISRKVIVDWKASPAIKTGAPADNTLLVWASGGEFRCYVNGQYLFSASDSTLSAGFYGIYLNDHTAGGATVLFDTLVARAVAK